MFELAFGIALLIGLCILFPVVFKLVIIVAFILAIFGGIKWLFPSIGVPRS